VDVRFGNHRDKAEADCLALLPTAFRLSDEEVDILKVAARTILTESDEFRRLLRDLAAEGSPKASSR
jgi:NTE family protein